MTEVPRFVEGFVPSISSKDVRPYIPHTLLMHVAWRIALASAASSFDSIASTPDVYIFTFGMMDDQASANSELGCLGRRLPGHSAKDYLPSSLDFDLTMQSCL